MTNDEELVGGCCVCSVDQGFSNNALVYCDGKGCRVACHTACYGIVSIPDGDWYCRRCEAGDIQAPCCLCPITEGAMKRTSDGNWAHVVCALYIPEVSFGNDETMEPIILSKVPSMRYGQTCSICIQNGHSKSDARKGACCECRFKNCSKLFHVTCAQQAGLLFEDVRKNTWQYPIYCEHHQPKFSRFIRQVPPFHYQSSEHNQNRKQKQYVSESLNNIKNSNNQIGKFISVEKREASTTVTSQNSSKNNPSLFVEIKSVKQTSQSPSNQNQSTIETRDSSDTNSKCSNNDSEQQQATTMSADQDSLSFNNGLHAKIKIELNETDFQVTEKTGSDTNKHMLKKRQHWNDDLPRSIDRPLAKRLLVSHSESSIHSISPNENLKVEESHDTRSPFEEIVKNPSRRPNMLHQQPFQSQTLEEFLEHEWEMTSDLLLQQNVSSDISSLLSFLYRFKAENASLKKKFEELKHRRDSLRVINANLRQRLSETLATNNTLRDSSDLPVNTEETIKTSNSPTHEHQIKLDKNIPTTVSFMPSTSMTPSSSLSYESVYPYVMNKNSQIPFNHGLGLELLSQIFTPSGPQFFAPTWNISNFGYANFPGTNSISLTEESFMRSYLPFRK